MHDTRKYPLIVISGPAAAGKTEIATRLLELFPTLQRVVTCTTRPMRLGEEDGVSYHFLSEDTFETASLNQEFLEQAEVHGKRYGTRHCDIDSTREQGPALIILDPQGTETAARLFPDAYCIFIQAPDEDIEDRLMKRCSGMSDFSRRMQDLKTELQYSNRRYYACVINNVNGELPRSMRQIIAMIGELLR